jgi:cytochrome oxidase Cu insertion factor (SCO1/SenC/PrrC family)
VRSSDINAIAVGTVLGIAFVGSWILLSQPAAPRADVSAVTFTDVSGGSFRLQDLRGKVVLLNFFADW